MSQIQVLGRVNSGHADLVHDVKFDHFGTSLATCSSDRVVKIFHVEKDDTGGQNIVHAADLKGHDDAVWQVSWANPLYGTVLASCGYDKKVIIWRQEAGHWNQLHEYVHDSSVNCLAFAPFDLGRLMLACGASDGNIIILSYQDDGSWKPVKIPNAHPLGVLAVSWGDPFFMPINGKRGETVTARLATGGCDNMVKIWRENGDSGPWSEEVRLDKHTEWVRDVAWRINRLFEHTTIASASQDRTVLIWKHDGHSGWTYELLKHFEDVPWTLSFNPTGSSLGVFWGMNSMTIFRDTNGKWQPITEAPSEEEDGPRNEEGDGKQADSRPYEGYDATQVH
ncbi:protein SEC13 homolog [Paramacrobiotus metropolitanus]|uniref:protein SEC13 homolog n=1 Tax=Paramacrobiotus metropolitanus TaxID=2943436 RepID=UPI002446121A|nr:protein SEC13 homolog [Paramacrobiotus metropolitanus]